MKNELKFYLFAFIQGVRLEVSFSFNIEPTNFHAYLSSRSSLYFHSVGHFEMVAHLQFAHFLQGHSTEFRSSE